MSYLNSHERLFRRESLRAASLALHDNQTVVYGMGSDGGYVTMTNVHGETKHIVKSTTLTVKLGYIEDVKALLAFFNSEQDKNAEYAFEPFKHREFEVYDSELFGPVGDLGILGYPTIRHLVLSTKSKWTYRKANKYPTTDEAFMFLSKHELTDNEQFYEAFVGAKNERNGDQDVPVVTLESLTRILKSHGVVWNISEYVPAPNNPNSRDKLELEAAKRLLQQKYEIWLYTGNDLPATKESINRINFEVKPFDVYEPNLMVGLKGVSRENLDGDKYTKEPLSWEMQLTLSGNRYSSKYNCDSLCEDGARSLFKLLRYIKDTVKTEQDFNVVYDGFKKNDSLKEIFEAKKFEDIDYTSINL